MNKKFQQLEMISKVKELSQADLNISANMMYGSFTKGEGDQFSDIEFYIFLNDDKKFDSLNWVKQICPVLMFFKNEYGTEVAIFDNLIRGEFHFLPKSEINIIKSWEGLVSFEHEDEMILVDKEGLLSGIFTKIATKIPERRTEANIQWLSQSLLNSLLLTGNLLKRGELAHAHNSFNSLQKYILWLFRLREDSTRHWESPTKSLEQSISPDAYKEYKSIAPELEERSLLAAYMQAINISKKLFIDLNVEESLNNVLESIDRRETSKSS
ncbi:aminoglycoside 6-adenylyltransferase [Bdellovibrio sp.]|jgi:lincosamide nucleotidyltransferase|uniref:aminoglycoside 6-adenylyltransferase n=1 Tax=Bdellovibrio sp. TaxID=28201 RepID=UPI003221784D